MTIPRWGLPYAADDVISAAQLSARGIDSHEVRRLVRTGLLHQLCTGWYATRAPTDEADRHLLRARAVLRHLGGRAALSHESRVLAAGLPVWRAELGAVHVTRVRDEITRRRPHVVSHSRVPGLVNASVPGFGLMVPIPVAIVQTGLVAGAMDAAIAADAALHTKLLRRDDLRTAVELLAGHRGLRRTAAALDRCDSRHESAGETRLAHVMADLDVAVSPQFRVETRLGQRFADFRIDGTRVLLEFDGKVKYTDPKREGDVLWREKLRQDALEDEGWTVVRVTWADLADPAALWRRIRAAIARSRARTRPREPR